MRVFIDTSVIVAGSVQHHPHFPRAVVILEQLAKTKIQGAVAAHSLLESYAVMTSLPVKPRIHPTEARAILQTNVERYCKTIALTAPEYRRFVTGLSDAGIVGGAVYDALLLACAKRSACNRIYTFNVDHFRRLAPDLSEIIAAP